MDVHPLIWRTHLKRHCWIWMLHIATGQRSSPVSYAAFLGFDNLWCLHLHHVTLWPAAPAYGLYACLLFQASPSAGCTGRMLTPLAPKHFIKLPVCHSDDSGWAVDAARLAGRHHCLEATPLLVGTAQEGDEGRA